MNHVDSFLITLNYFESLWIILNNFESLWITLNYFESLWNHFESFWSHFEPLWIILNRLNHFESIFFSVLVWALAAIVAAEVSNPDVQDQTKMFVAGLLSISCVFLLLRIILVILRQRSKPIGQDYDNVDSSDPSRSGISTYGSIFWINN